VKDKSLCETRLRIGDGPSCSPTIAAMVPAVKRDGSRRVSDFVASRTPELVWILNRSRTSVRFSSVSPLVLLQCNRF
jgi:hypothetical protein